MLRQVHNDGTEAEVAGGRQRMRSNQTPTPESRADEEGSSTDESTSDDGPGCAGHPLSLWSRSFLCDGEGSGQ